MKYDGYDVYDIIYRNDSGVRKLLERDQMFLATGFITLQDGDGRFWYLYKKGGMLIPEKQEYLGRTYGRRDTLPTISRIKIGKDECECSSPAEEFARDFFIGLSKINACADWKIEKRLWKILSNSSLLYDAPARMVRPEQYTDRVTILKCAYVSDRKTKRRNFSNFADWKYIAVNEITSEKKAEISVDLQLSATPVEAAPKTVQEKNASLAPAGTALDQSILKKTVQTIATQTKEAPANSLSSRTDAASFVSPRTASANPMPSSVDAAGSVLPRTVPANPVLSKANATSPVSSRTALIEPAPSRTAVKNPEPPKPEPANVEPLKPAPADIEPPKPEPANVEPLKPASANVEPLKPVSADSERPESALVNPELLKETPVSPAPVKPASAVSVSKTAPAQNDTVSQKKQKPEKRVVTDIRRLLECDKRRCRLEAYEENMLYDIKRGHWDLYDLAKVENQGKEKLVSRDPRKDIRTGVVGIDFGTKSTVVVRQDDTSAIMPIRIGAEVLSDSLRESDYENPTIIECTNLDEFIKKYYEQEGRPQTSCEDFFVSYDAYNNYRTCPPSEFYAYYADLKQWANHEKENVVVLDKQRQEYRFGAEGSQQERIINPIELYAYYIGMYINNMRNGIYMKYLMSFPVGYSKETRKLIVTSFEKGIKKSLPTCVLEDEECMKEFSVSLGISEPAAYAVTALEMSELDPEDENDKYRYGIFDFGGGTADFGFGIWRGASEEEYEFEGYDYVLECFGADSDVTLGGEKILELLAYAVFKKNRELARRKRITCSLPFGERPFPGSESLLSNSQIAQRNMSILKEELRPLWHQEEDWEQKYHHDPEGGSPFDDSEEYIEISMYDIDGNKQPDCRLVIDTEELISLIKARIQKGIDAFFKCMTKAFRREDAQSEHDGMMYIFLAGNSSKSVFVKELFEKTIREYSDRVEGACFKLMEPLNAGDNGEYEYVPNAKTSVAYGLIKSREGSSIKVEKNFETDAEEQTRFKYYLGRERKHHFDCRLSPVETEYGAWIRFQGAAKQTVRIYYTTNPTADVREEPPVIDDIPYREIVVEPQKGAFLFIRACEPTAIEYAVALSEESIGETGEICRMDFGM